MSTTFAFRDLDVTIVNMAVANFVAAILMMDRELSQTQIYFDRLTQERDGYWLGLVTITKRGAAKFDHIYHTSLKMARHIDPESTVFFTPN